MKKFLALYIYKEKGRDWSNGGLSSKYDECYIECEDGYLTEDQVPADAIVKLSEPNIFGSFSLVPVQPVPEGYVSYMAGGCYVATSDGRFSRLIEKKFGIHFYGAVALHDRTETWEEYEVLSK